MLWIFLQVYGGVISGSACWAHSTVRSLGTNRAGTRRPRWHVIYLRYSTRRPRLLIGRDISGLNVASPTIVLAVVEVLISSLIWPADPTGEGSPIDLQQASSSWRWRMNACTVSASGAWPDADRMTARTTLSRNSSLGTRMASQATGGDLSGSLSVMLARICRQRGGSCAWVDR